MWSMSKEGRGVLCVGVSIRHDQHFYVYVFASPSPFVPVRRHLVTRPKYGTFVDGTCYMTRDSGSFLFSTTAKAASSLSTIEEFTAPPPLSPTRG